MPLQPYYLYELFLLSICKYRKPFSLVYYLFFALKPDQLHQKKRLNLPVKKIATSPKINNQPATQDYLLILK
ncbi:hypothetical protein EGK14_14055 [Erwinia sp. 198]|nr:hypothetical protein EGK14_14055 [Erwinia sp. 198]